MKRRFYLQDIPLDELRLRRLVGDEKVRLLREVEVQLRGAAQTTDETETAMPEVFDN